MAKESKPAQAEKTPAQLRAERLAKTFADAVKAAVGGDRDHGWGVEDSAEVIETVIAADAEECADGVKYTPSDEAMELVKGVINPSAFRQKLEGKLLNEAKPQKRKGTVASIVDQFGE